MLFMINEQGKPRVWVIDENQVDDFVPFRISEVASLIYIIFRMPLAPLDYFQVTAFSNWHRSRLEALRAYARQQNRKYANYSVQFDVKVGSRHDIIRTFNAEHELLPAKIKKAPLRRFCISMLNDVFKQLCLSLRCIKIQLSG